MSRLSNINWNMLRFLTILHDVSNKTVKDSSENNKNR